MNKNIANITLVILLSLVALFGYLNLTVKDKYKSKKIEYIAFEKSAKKIYLIKKLKRSIPAILSTLSSIKKPTVKDRTTSKVYIFENLNLNDLHKLIKRVQGAYIPIKKLEIKRDTTNHAMVTLEVLK
jgi:hypothetical protein